MATTKDLRAAMEATTRQFFAAYVESGERNDPTIINRNVDPECKRFYRPMSLCNWFGVPPDWSHDNEAYKAGIAANLEHGSIKTCEVFNLTIDVDTRRSAAMTVSNMVFKDGEELIMEHAWSLDFNGDGSKVVKVVEFCDQLATRRMVSKVHPRQLVAESEISDRRRPIIIDQQPSKILPVGTEPVRYPYTVGYTRLISSAPELTSGNYEATRQQRREQKEREEAELEQRVRLRSAERNAKIASRPVAPAPPNPHKKSEKSSQNRSQDLVEHLEPRDRRARHVAIRKEQKEKEEEEEEEERYRKLLRERMQPRRWSTTGCDSQRWPEFSNSEGLYRYSDDKPDENGESSEQKGRPNANADENRYSVEGYTKDPGI